MIDTVQKLAAFISKNESIVIYGAGGVAGLLADWCMKVGAMDKISCFAVSNIETNRRKLYGKPVREISCENIWQDGRKKVVLIATMQKLQNDIKTFCKKVVPDAEIHSLDDALIYILRDANASRHLREDIKYYSDRVLEGIEKCIPNTQLAFSVHLCEHCNLNCVGCNNFSPLAQEEYTDITQFEKDMQRLSCLSGGIMHRIQLMGGEPLLNERAIDYAIITRKYFPIGRVSFITNGLLVNKQSDEFFELCKKNDIAMEITRYPVGVDYYKIQDMLEEKGISCKFFPDENFVWTKEVYNLDPTHPKSPATYNWLRCYKTHCIQLKDGKMSCTKISCVHHFIDAFPEECKHMKVVPDDFIDIYEVENIQEIFNFFAHPYSFCKYCDVSNNLYNVEWGKSKKEITEWIVV